VNKLQTGFVTLITGGLLLGAGSVASPGALAASGGTAQPSGSNVASTACAPGAGAWTDCALMLNQPVAAGGEVAAAVPTSDGTVSYCEQSASPDADSAGDNTVAPAGTLCGVSGNTAVFTCVDGCSAGTALSFSLLGGTGMPSDNALAQQITVTSGGTPSQTALPPAAGA
jgi:hypothetical protein